MNKIIHPQEALITTGWHVQNPIMKANRDQTTIVALCLFIVVGGYGLSRTHPLEFVPVETAMWHEAFELFVSYSICVGVAVFVVGLRKLAFLRSEVHNRERAHSKAVELALHDELTGLPNRRMFQEVFTELTQSINPGKHRAVMMLDIDGFKPINDVYGHAFGDTLLQILGQRLSETVGVGGTVARLGGDEFAVISAEIDEKDEATALAHRLLARIQESFELGSRQVSVGSGIGISIFPEDGHSSSELLRRADIALYRAKSSGRASYRYFEVEMDASVLHRTLLEQRLRNALAEDDLQVHYQPIVDLAQNRITGFEALPHWNDRDFGVVAPEQFFPIAEDAGLITDLTEQLLSKACKAATDWPVDVFLSFNISPLQLRDHSFPLKVMSILASSGLAANRLILEITETSLLKDPANAMAILQQLTDANIRIALDDFGTGYSSLTYLRDFPIDRVKIDRSFTTNMTEDKESAAIVAAILVLSQGLGIEAVAEGVEQPETLDQLSEKGCVFGQGSLFGAAESAEAVDRILANQDPMHLQAKA